jgi:cell division septum initiation protein DivIVA
MISYKITNSLAEKDEQFLNIEKIIDAKRRMLLEKQKKFKLIQKQNQFLDIIKDDYSKYYSYISKQKQDQIKALEILNSYISDLTTSGKLTKNNINDAGFEQKKIIKEIKSIRKGLDGIMDSTNYLNSQLN